jgi:hypothetical protein
VSCSALLLMIVGILLCSSNWPGERSPSALCSRVVLDQPTHSTIASSSCDRVRQTCWSPWRPPSTNCSFHCRSTSPRSRDGAPPQPACSHPTRPTTRASASHRQGASTDEPRLSPRDRGPSSQPRGWSTQPAAPQGSTNECAENLHAGQLALYRRSRGWGGVPRSSGRRGRTGSELPMPPAWGGPVSGSGVLKLVAVDEATCAEALSRAIDRSTAR